MKIIIKICITELNELEMSEDQMLLAISNHMNQRIHLRDEGELYLDDINVELELVN
jgi:hypothetical protein